MQMADIIVENVRDPNLKARVIAIMRDVVIATAPATPGGSQCGDNGGGKGGKGCDYAGTDGGKGGIGCDQAGTDGAPVVLPMDYDEQDVDNVADDFEIPQYAQQEQRPQWIDFDDAPSDLFDTPCLLSRG